VLLTHQGFADELSNHGERFDLSVQIDDLVRCSTLQEWFEEVIVDDKESLETAGQLHQEVKSQSRALELRRAGSMQRKVTLGRGCTVRGKGDWLECFEGSMDCNGSKNPQGSILFKGYLNENALQALPVSFIWITVRGGKAQWGNENGVTHVIILKWVRLNLEDV
jgi:hypothetical protein